MELHLIELSEKMIAPWPGLISNQLNATSRMRIIKRLLSKAERKLESSQLTCISVLDKS